MILGLWKPERSDSDKDGALQAKAYTKNVEQACCRRRRECLSALVGHAWRRA
jgi:hypothetical protein